MLVGNVRQFQLYDELVIEVCHESIEKMVLKAAKALYSYVAKQNKITILCGKGHNGADGLALACLLKSAGKEVVVFLTCDQKQLSTATSFYLKRALNLEIPIFHLKALEEETMRRRLDRSEVIVDAIYGTGFKGEVQGLERDAITYINETEGVPILAVDVPSGLNVNHGYGSITTVKAHLTVTFVANKLGYLNPEAKKYTGEIYVESFDYPSDLLEEVGFSELLQPEMLNKILRPRLYHGYKGQYGQLLCLTGSKKYPGAAIISCGAALKSGVGLVSVYSEVFEEVLRRYPEIVACCDFHVSMAKSSAILFGCGKGQSEKSKNELTYLLAHANQPLLLDADGINIVAKNLFLLEKKRCPVILTPHYGEMARLLIDCEEKDLVLGAIAFARQYRVIIVLKGPHTLVTDGEVSYRLPSGDKAMATAGMGDALAGIIASFLAQGYQPLEACLLGTYLHGLAGETLAKEQYSVFASDIIELLPKIMNRL